MVSNIQFKKSINSHFFQLFFIVLFIVSISSCNNNTHSESETFNILVFSKTAGFIHSSIDEGQEAIRKLADEVNFKALFTTDSAMFKSEVLDTMHVVIFLNTTGDVLDDHQQEHFQKFIQNGNGFIGIHAATDTEYDWPWYGKMVGAYFESHPEIQEAELNIMDHNHVSTIQLPQNHTLTEEWYNFKDLQKDDLNFLISVDESSYSGGNMGDFHPISWYHEYDGGRAFYTELGHREETYSDPFFFDHLAGAILWAAGRNN